MIQVHYWWPLNFTGASWAISAAADYVSKAWQP